MPELDELAQQIRVCQLCILSKSRKNAVPGEGPPHADIMFIGEGPGFHEDQQGRPFVGAAGKFLEELLENVGLKREDVYITNVVKCFISPRVLIYTVEGYKPIKDIRPGDLVLTHKGRFRKVVYVRPQEVLPRGSSVVRFTVRSKDGGNARPVSLTVTPEHPFLVNGRWKSAKDIQVGDEVKALGDRCEICGRTYFVRYDRYEARSYHTCSYRCHNRRIFHSDEARRKVSQAMAQQYAVGARDRRVITTRANKRTRELVAAGRAKIQHLTKQERHQSRVAWAANITAGKSQHRIGYGEEELKEILDRIGVDYIHGFAFPGSSLIFDFCLPHFKVLLEVRGPGFNNQAAQERAMVKDHLAKEHGYLVVNLWWAQIVEQPQMVEEILGRILKNHAGKYAFVDLVVTEVEHRNTRRAFPLYNIGVEEDESYMAAGIVSHNCRPPGNRDPQADEIEACRPYLDRQIELIAPKMIVTLGRYSMERFFPGQQISRIHGQPRRIAGRVVVPMYHPAAGLHQPRWKSVIEQDFQKLPRLLKELERVDEQEPPPTAQQLSLF